MNLNKITVFTPTYNRAYTLSKCYESLCSQDNKNFMWLIVDDGSTDDTELIVRQWITENKINIKYIKQRNNGKQAAHNTGVLACSTNIFVCVDSDDILTINSIQRIYDKWEEINKDEHVAGLIALKGYSASKPLKSEIPHQVQLCSIFDLYDKYKFKGDTMLVFKTEVLRENLFPSFDGEKFVTEAVIYDRISQKYKMYLLNEVLYLCEYLPDGYSANIKEVLKNNPKGYMYFLLQRIEFAKTFKAKYKASAYYIAGSWSINKRINFKKIENKFIMSLSFPKAIIIYIKPLIKAWLKRRGVISED